MSARPGRDLPRPRHQRERLAFLLAGLAMAAVLVLTLTPRGTFGLLTAQPAMAAEHLAGDGAAPDER